MNESLNRVQFVIEDEADRSSLGYVYVLRGLGLGSKFYKIGRSRDVYARMQQLRSNTMPFDFELVYWHPIEDGNPNIEFDLHRYFKAFRTRGEWFYFETERELCIALEGWMGMCPAEMYEGYRLEAEHYRRLEIVGLV